MNGLNGTKRFNILTVSTALVALLMCAVLVAACGNTTSGPPDEPVPAQTHTRHTIPTVTYINPTDSYLTVYGTRLPDDAAPYEQQVYRVACDINSNQTTFDFAVSVYQRVCQAEGHLSDLFQDQLVTLDKDFQVIPAAAERWEMSDDGRTWTFFLRPGLLWSDGTAVTAHDWVATYRLLASPEYAWDFAWFYDEVLLNWPEVNAGQLPPEELGVHAIDDLTLQFTTQTPLPAFPAMMQYSLVLQKHALETHGPNYNSQVETSVSSGPFILSAYEPGVRVELLANPTYTGYRQPKLYKIVGVYRDMRTALSAFQNHELDYLNDQWLSRENYVTIERNAVLRENFLRHYGDFRTDYLFFDTTTPPFDDVLVRKAFAHALDRETIVRDVLGEQRAMPAYGMLMPGFPAADTTGALKPLQAYDCEQAQALLAEAGYPDGKEFPTMELWLRNETETFQDVYRAAASSIKQCLGIEITVSNKDELLFMDALNAKPTRIQFGAVSYGMDFLDPSSLLGVWVSGGRHTWHNPAYDDLVQQTTSLMQNPEQRIALFQQAETILADDVGAVFLAHRWQADLVQPYVVGDAFRATDAHGVAGWHWGNDWGWRDVYISEDVSNYTTYRDNEQ